MKRIVVVGGGIAGLATAFELRERAARVPGGLEVRLVEAAPRLGGNLRTEQRRRLPRRVGTERLSRQRPRDARPGAAARSRGRSLPLGRRGRTPLSLPQRPPASPARRARELPHLPGVESARAPAGARRAVRGEAPGRRRDGLRVRPPADRRRGGACPGRRDGLRRLRRRRAPALARQLLPEDGRDGGGARRAGEGDARQAARPRRRAARARGASRARRGRPRDGASGRPGRSRRSPDLVPRRHPDLHRRARDGARARRSRAGARSSVWSRIDGREGSTRLWRLDFAGGELLEADEVVLAVPAAQAAPLVAPLDEELAANVCAPSLRPRSPSSRWPTTNATFRARALGRGAGRTERLRLPRAARLGAGPRILGALWDSSVFPGERAPAGKVLLRVMIGGALDPEAVGLPEDELLRDRARRPRRNHGARRPTPSATGSSATGSASASTPSVTRRDWRRSPPASRLLPGLHVAGQSYFGVSMNGCCEQAARFAEERVTALERTTRMRVLIAGCGDLGTALGVELAAAGDEVFGLRRHPEALPPRSVPSPPTSASPRPCEPCRRSRLWSMPRRPTARPTRPTAPPTSTACATCSLLRPSSARLPGALSSSRAPRSTPRTAASGSTRASPAEATHFRARLLLEGELLMRDGRRARDGDDRRCASPASTARAARGCSIWCAPAAPPIRPVHRATPTASIATTPRARSPTFCGCRQPAPLYLGVDDAPVDLAEVLTFLAVELGAPLPRLEDAPAAGGPDRPSKRCSNALLRSTGYRLRYPTYREGYGALLSTLPAKS